MRLVIIGPVSPVRGGIAHHTTELCTHLNQKSDVIVFSMERLYTNFIHSLLYKGNSTLDGSSKKEVITFNKKRTLSINPFSWLKCAIQIRKLQPDYVIFIWADPYLFPLAWTVQTFMSKKTKLLFLCHELLLHERPFGRHLSKMIFKKVDTFLVHSNNDINIIKKLVPSANIKKVFHPIYDRFYTHIDKNDAKQKLGIKGNTLLFFGYIRKYKGLSYLLESLPKVLKEVNVTLLIVGEFWENKEDYLKQVRRLEIENNIKIIDRYVSNEEISTFFSAADVVIAPYTSASQSGVINIAYAFNKPVIATNVGGLGDMVRDGKTGYLIEPGNSNALSESIIKFYEAKNKTKFSEEIKIFKKQFTWEELCKQILDVS